MKVFHLLHVSCRLLYKDSRDDVTLKGNSMVLDSRFNELQKGVWQHVAIVITAPYWLDEDISVI